MTAMASSHDIFHFGSSPSPGAHSSSGVSLFSPPTVSSVKHAAADDMDTSPPTSPISSPIMPPSAHSPDIAMDNRPTGLEEEEDDSDSEDDNNNGVSLEAAPPSAPSITDLIDSMEWQLPTQIEQTETLPPLHSHESNGAADYPDPFDSTNALILQANEGLLPYLTTSTASMMPTIMAAALGDADSLQQYSQSSDFEDALEDALGLPSVSDHQAVIDVCKFIDHWAVAGGLKGDLGIIGLEASRVRDWKRPAEITKDELQGDRYDIQGINWEELDTTRDNARAARLKLSTRKATPPPPGTLANKLPSSENYFRFRKMNTTHRISVAHFQLRNLISAISRSDIFYASKSKVMHTDASGQMTRCAMDLTKPMGDPMHPSTFSITTLTASDEVLIAGGFYGEYALTNLRSEVGEPPVQGYVTHEYNGITNHAHTFDSRNSGLPQGVFCSNDRCLRILDCTTNTFTHEFHYKQAINCSATSPNGRMRVIVGDFDKALITDAETGKPFEHLPSHTDHVFACAWADDGIHVATGSQDHKIVVWDARRWDTPLATFASVMSCPRSLRFSPVGGGRRVLFAAEAEDIVSVFDGYDFDKRQVLDFYGATAGISVTPDGQSLFVANGDGKFGGLMEFERCQFAEPWGVEEPRRSWKGHRMREERLPRGAWEWVAEEDLDEDPRVVGCRKARERRGMGLEELYV